MTKQEEIREGVAKLIAESKGGMAYEDMPLPVKAIQLYRAKEFLQWLRSRGCVIRVAYTRSPNQEFPVAVESLIKE